MSIPRDRRTTKERPCPACGHPHRSRYGHCFFLPASDAVWCANEPRYGGRAGITRKGGWVHRLKAESPPPAVRPRPRVAPAPTRTDWAELTRRFRAQVTSAMARGLSDSLGLNVSSLRRLGLGWATRQQLLATGTKCSGEGCWTFPMRDAGGAVVGMRLRAADGFKYSVQGSDGQGLFVPGGLKPGGTLLLPEGPTSCAALLLLGLAAVGRPNNRAGIDNLRGLIARGRPGRVVIVGDNDWRENPVTGRAEWPGRDGAMATAAAMRGAAPEVICALPPGRRGEADPLNPRLRWIKDVREWLAAGAERADVLSLAVARLPAWEVAHAS